MSLHTRAIAVFLLITSIGALPVTVQSLKGEESQHSEPIPWAEIGARAGAEYNGDGVSIVPGEDGAVIDSSFQRLRGDATPEGLWLSSTVEGTEADRFRVLATSMGRSENGERRTENEEPGTGNQALPTTGRIDSDGRLVQFVRPGLIEEYFTSVDGVRQDFVVEERPEGEGELRVELAVDGARAEEADFGARLRLENSGRHVAYSRLHVEDAEGRVLPARIEVAAADRVAILVADADAVYPVRIDPTFSDENWISMGGLPGANRGVLAAVAAEDGTLFVGGRFSVIGDVFANRIARWDGSSWSALGEGMDDTVRALAVVGDHLYAGGGFIMAGGVSANHIARWDGNSWSALGSGMDDWVAALAVSGGDLYAGGSFTTAGGVTANRTARWDGSSWAALGSGMAGAGLYPPEVDALAVSGDDLYAGGNFTTAGGVSATGVARWDGASWSTLGSGMNGRVSALAVSGGDLYVGGGFTFAGGKVSAYAAKTNIAVSLSNGTVVEQREPGTVVGILSAIEIGETAPEPTVFTLVGGPGDEDNAFFTIEDDRLKTAEALDQEVQDHFTIRVRATYADGTQKEKVFLLRVDRNGFLVWAEELPPDRRGEADDPGNHGIPNLLRYAFGMDPTAPDREALPRPVLSETTVEGESRIHLTLPYTRRTDDPELIFTPESSEDLDTWTPLVDAEEVSGSDETTETVIVTDPEPVDAKPKSFLRVRVERND